MLESSGTGFAVDTEGGVITNHHVVEACSRISVVKDGKAHPARLVADDMQYDLAFLKIEGSQSSPKPLSLSTTRVGLGQSAISIGFPLRGVLASTPNLATGVISALAGIRDDPLEFQITVPVQPGNSGGPLLDESGNVIGVVVAKINALAVAVAIGDLPENIGFAIKGSVLESFLRKNAVRYLVAPSITRKSVPLIAREAEQSIMAIECWK